MLDPSRSTRAGVDRAPNHAAWERYDTLFPALVNLYPPAKIGSEFWAVVTFAPEAHQHRERFPV